MNPETHCPNCFNPPKPTPRCLHCGFDASVYAGANDLLPPFTPLAGGNYLIGRVLGEGGFGVVYVGLDCNLDRLVAIKEFFPASDNPLARRQGTRVTARAQYQAEFSEWKDNFLREARLLACFNHPRLVQVYAIAQENNTVYLMMELLKGHSLSDHLGGLKRYGMEVCAGRALSSVEGSQLLSVALEALEVLHGHQPEPVIHRDLTPYNLFLVNGEIEQLKVLDFGLARLGERLQNDHSIAQGVGNPGFASPEQLGYYPAGITPATDFYTLGASLYTALAGVAPPNAKQRCDEKKPLPPLLNVETSLARVIEACLEISPGKRPQSVADIRQRLAAATILFPDSEPIQQPTPEPQPKSEPKPEPKPESIPESREPESAPTPVSKPAPTVIEPKFISIDPQSYRTEAANKPLAPKPKRSGSRVLSLFAVVAVLLALAYWYWENQHSLDFMASAFQKTPPPPAVTPSTPAPVKVVSTPPRPAPPPAVTPSTPAPVKVISTPPRPAPPPAVTPSTPAPVKVAPTPPPPPPPAVTPSTPAPVKVVSTPPPPPPPAVTPSTPAPVKVAPTPPPPPPVKVASTPPPPAPPPPPQNQAAREAYQVALNQYTQAGTAFRALVRRTEGKTPTPAETRRQAQEAARKAEQASNYEQATAHIALARQQLADEEKAFRARRLEVHIEATKVLLDRRRVAAARRALADAKRWDSGNTVDAFRRRQTDLFQTVARGFLEKGEWSKAQLVIDDLGQWDPDAPEYQSLKAQLKARRR